MQPFKLLMIEDEDLTASLVSKLLEDQGYVVKVVRNPEAALDQALEYKPDLIISDIDMPRVSGFELARNFSRHVALQDTPVVLLTSLVTRDVLLTARKLGVREVFSKRGLDAAELVARIAKLVPAADGEEIPVDEQSGADDAPVVDDASASGKEAPEGN